MFEDFSATALATTVLADLAEQGVWSTVEGTLPHTLVLPLCSEIARAYMSMDVLAAQVWVDGSGSQFLTLAAEAYGIYRKVGTPAVCNVSFVGKAGTVIPIGTTLSTDDALLFGLDAAVTIGADGTATGTATATANGAQYNIDAGELTRTQQGIVGLTSVTNEAALGGVDDESDALLYARLDAHRKTPATSGNVAHYRQWALSVPGVGYAKIRPLWDGPGTVGVVLAAPDGGGVSAETVANAADYIETERPIGAAVTVRGADVVTVTVAMSLQLDASVAASDVADDIKDGLSMYIASLLELWQQTDGDYTVLYNRMLAIILSVQGVVDVTALTINGVAANLTLYTEQIAQLGEVTINVAG